jgi:hypothetical protein
MSNIFAIIGILIIFFCIIDIIKFMRKLNLYVKKLHKKVNKTLQEE